MTEITLPENADDMFCHAIYSTWHVVNRAYKKHLSPLGLTYPQYITLTLLWEKDARIVSELATGLAMETSTLTPLLKRLEAEGLVQRARSKTDERRVVVNLTEKGRALKAESRAITACMVQDTGLDIEDLDQLVGLLHKMRGGFKG